MPYRVIYSDFVRHSDGFYQAMDGTERSRGVVEKWWDAYQTSLSWDSSYHIAWVEVLDTDGLWHYADTNGRPAAVASIQDIPEDED
jgi:hypothetical protein